MPAASLRSAPSRVTSTQPSTNPSTNTIPPSHAACDRPCGTGWPSNAVGTVSSGSMNSVPVLMTDDAVRLVATSVPSTPESVSMRHCIAPPAAAPPGTTRLKALDASCAVATPNHPFERSARRCSPQMQTKLAASHASITKNHAGSRSSSFGQLSSTSSRLGHRM